MHENQKDPIEHVIVLMFENRSFDQMLGAFQQHYPTLDGVDPAATPRHEIVDGQKYEQMPTAVRRASNDPNHELASVLRQIGAPPAVPGNDDRRPWPVRFLVVFCQIVGSWFAWAFRKITSRRPPVLRTDARMGYQPKFVEEYIRNFPTSTLEQRNEVMAYFPIGELPALHLLAEHFAICDRWFASVPGPTWVNRFFVHTGTARGIVRMPNDPHDLAGIALHDQKSIYDALNERGKSWRIYYHDTPQSLALARQWLSQNKLNYAHIDRLESDVAGPAKDFPEFVFIEPQYTGNEASDYHPPYDVMAGEALIARVYNAIRSNQELWRSTLLIITFDEHGGYYDHVEPPGALPPDRCALEYAFDRLGVRVPTVLVSPWVRAGVFPDDKEVHFDHTSIGRYLCNKWGLAPLGDRMRQANGIESALRPNEPPRIDALPRIPPLPANQAVFVQTPNENQLALDLLSKHLDQEPLKPNEVRVFAAAPDAKPDPDVMRERVARFLNRG